MSTCSQLSDDNGSSKSLLPTNDGRVSFNLYPDFDSRIVSPFIKYENNEHPYVWPTLYDETDDMFDACCLIYALAELRQKVRQGELDDPTVLSLPLTALEVWNVVQSNQNYLKDSYFGNSFYVGLLAVLAKRHQKIVSPTGNSASNREQTHLVAFNDCNFQEEMVYGIAVNPTLKRITVCFRGSITKMDWSIDEEMYMTSIDNFVPASKNDAGLTLRIHNGFYKYLCAPLRQVRQEAQAKQNAKLEATNLTERDDNISQYQDLIQQHLLPLLKQYPGFKVYVTGHSLGGALATLFASLIASEPDPVIPKPVTCISFGSPYVGDESFRLAHKTLESLGKLRHLRVSNYQDLVTLMPFVSFRWKVWDTTAHVGAFFKHVGMNLRMFAPEKSSVPFQIMYPRVRTGLFTQTWDEWRRSWDYSLLGNWSWDWHVYFTWKMHSLNEYQKRLDANTSTLEVVYLNDLYANKKIVGHLIADF